MNNNGNDPMTPVELTDEEVEQASGGQGQPLEETYCNAKNNGKSCHYHGTVNSNICDCKIKTRCEKCGCFGINCTGYTSTAAPGDHYNTSTIYKKT